MSYNIKYANENDGENSWSLRKTELSEQIQKISPTILGMQEVVKEQLDFLLKENSQYKSVGVARDDGKEKGEYSPIFYDAGKLILKNSGTFWLSETPEVPGLGWDAAYPRVCSFAELALKKNATIEFFVFNTHFDHVGIEARKNALKLIQQKIEELNPTNKPYILMGDLNLNAESNEIQSFIKAMQDKDSTFSDTFYSNHSGSIGTFNGYKSDEEMPRIDYIFTSKFKIKKHKTITTKRKDNFYLSDHYPVWSILKFRN